MDAKLQEEVKERLARNESPNLLRASLIDGGYAEADIEEVLKSVSTTHLDQRDSRDRHNSRILAVREFIDRIGYGAAAPQFINILFYQTGAGLFLLGLFNGLRTIISMLLSAVLQEYSRKHKVSKDVIRWAGVLFGFSFLLMAFAVRARIVWVYAAAILLAGVGVVTYGDLYNKLLFETIRREKMGKVLAKMAQYGVLITTMAMLLSGWIIDRFPETAKASFTLFGMTFQPIGYLLAFEITAFAFIISGMLLHYVKEQREERTYPFRKFIVEHFSLLKKYTGGFLKQKYLALLVVATMISGLLEVLGQSYYGLYIYHEFRYIAFGGFLNVAVIYGIAIITSFTGPWFTKRLQKSIGLSPMLVFGTLLLAILPFTLVYNANLISVALALLLGVIGGAIIGVAQGLLVRKLMNEETRRRYFMSLGLIVTIPYLILIPVGSWVAATFGMTTLFLLIGLGLVVVVAPLYFILVAMANKERL